MGRRTEQHKALTISQRETKQKKRWLCHDLNRHTKWHVWWVTGKSHRSAKRAWTYLERWYWFDRREKYLGEDIQQ